MESRRDKKKFLRIVRNSRVDPLNDLHKESIISQIDRGTDMEVLEMDDFKLDVSLGSGISSDVCLLSRKKDDRKFAGKFAKAEISDKEFVNEATIIKLCSNNPAIINLVGLITTPRCLVLEYYRNGSLNIALQRDNKNVELGMESEFSFMRRLGYVLDMCKAVDHLHRKNICHRDIAMKNLLLSDSKEHVVLADFSLSRIVSTTLKTQSTFTAVVPRTSAPETLSKRNTSTSEGGYWERHYSLKSDIWSLGITIFEIFDQELGNIKEGWKMPSRFPTKRLPSKEVFTRMQDVWILIRRCWKKNPENRPNCWEVQERVKELIENPLNIDDGDDEYITQFSSNNESTHDDATLLSPSIEYGIQPEVSWMDTVIEDETHLPSVSSKFDSSISCMWAEQESSKNFQPSIMKNFYRTLSSYAKRCDAILSLGAKNQLKVRRKRSRYEVNKEFPSQPSFTATSSNHFSKYFRPKNLPSLIFLGQSNKSDTSVHKSHLNKRGRLMLLKRLRSVSSMLSTSFSSQHREPAIFERVEYCTPLSFSFKSEATNIKYCTDRHFFQTTSNDISAEEKPETAEYLLIPDTPRSESPADNQGSFK